MSVTASAAALTLLVLQNSALAILKHISFRDPAQRYSPSTAVLVAELVKFVVCSLMTYTNSSNPRLAQVVKDIKGQWLLLLPSLLYVVQNNLLYFGAERLSPVLYMICSQTKILATAFMSRVILGLSLSKGQLASLLLLSFGLIVVQLPENHSTIATQTSSSRQEETTGVIAMLIASIISGTAGVVLEKIFKMHRTWTLEHSTWTRNIQLSIISLPFALCGVLLEDSGLLLGREFFHGYDRVVLAVILLHAIGGITTGFVLKFANNVLKCIAVALAIVLCAAYSVVAQEREISYNLLLGTVLVITAVFLFSMTRLSRDHGGIRLPGKPSTKA